MNKFITPETLISTKTSIINTEIMYGKFGITTFNLEPNGKKSSFKKASNRLNDFFKQKQPEKTKGIAFKYPDGSYAPFVEKNKNYIQVSSPKTIKKERKKERKTVTRIVTGQCLFDASCYAETDTKYVLPITNLKEMNEQSFNKTGKIKKFIVPKGFTPSEILSTLNRGSLIQTIKKVKTEAEVIYNMPQTNYFLYGLDMIDKGFMDKEAFEEWVSIVKKRQKIICNLEKSVNPNVIFQDSFEDCQMLLDPNLKIEQLRTQLSKNNEWFKAYLQLNPNADYLDLSYASYPQIYFNALKDDRNVNFIAAEDASEGMIYSALTMWIRKMGLTFTNNVTMQASYIFPKILVVNAENYGMYSYFTKYKNPNKAVDLILEKTKPSCDLELFNIVKNKVEKTR